MKLREALNRIKNIEAHEGSPEVVCTVHEELKK
jgi:hypothetical protein